LTLRLNVWKKLSQIFKSLFENEMFAGPLQQILGVAVPPGLLIRINASIDLGIDDEVVKNLQSNPFLKPFQVDASSLIGAISNMPDDDALQAKIQTDIESGAAPLPIATFVRALMEDLGSEVELSVVNKLAGARIRVNSKGLDLAFKSFFKVLLSKR